MHLENRDFNRGQNGSAAGSRSGSRAALLAACYVINVLYGSYLAAIGVLLPRIGAQFHINASGQGRIMFAGFAGSIVSVILCGYLSDRLRRKVVLAACGALFGAGLLLFGAAPTELFALLAAPIIGAGSAGMQAVASALASDLYPEKRGIVINACQVAFAAGAVVGPAVIYHVVASGISWRSVYFALACAAMLVTALIGSRPQAAPIGNSSIRSAGSTRTLLLQPLFVLLCTAQLFYAGAEVGFFEWMPTYFQSALHGGGELAGKVISIFWLAMTFGRLAMGALLGRFDHLKSGIVLALTGASAAFLALLAERPVAAALLVGLTGLSYGGVYSAILVEAGDRYHAGAALGTALGCISAAGSAGSAIIPWIIGAVAVNAGRWSMAVSLAPASAVAAAILMAFVIAQRENMPEDRILEYA